MVHLPSLRDPDPLRVLAADSTSMSTQLLVEALAREGRFQMIECAPVVAGILALVKREKPQVALISAKLGENSSGGFEAVREIRAQAPETRLIMLLDTSERNFPFCRFSQPLLTNFSESTNGLGEFRP